MPPERDRARTRRRRAWLGVGILVALLAALSTGFKVDLLPPSLERDSREFASATTQVLVDTPEPSSLLDLSRVLTPLAERANVYSRLLTSPTLVQLAAREADVPADRIEAKGPFNPNQPRAVREPTAERRAQQLYSESTEYRLRFESEQNLPLVTIFAQAPSVAEAERLANGAAQGLRTYVERIQREQGIRGKDRATVSQLGPATGGLINPGASQQVALLTFMGVLVAWWLLGQLISAGRSYARRRRLSADQARTVGAPGVPELAELPTFATRR
jgi:hypothetical protein